MASAPPTKPPQDPALLAPWSAYRLWASTSRHYRKSLDRLTGWSLVLSITGAITATLGLELKSLTTPAQLLPAIAIGIGYFSTGVVAIGTFLSQLAQADNRVSIWTRSRSAAESLKSAIILYRAGVPPFDGPDRAAQIRQRTEKVIDDMKDVASRQPGADKEPDLSPLTIDDYITQRIQDQIRWYDGKAADNQRSADRLHVLTNILLGIGALITAFAAFKGVSDWAPVVATIAASITAHLKNKQFQMLSATYSATSLRLKLLLGDWAAANKTDADRADRNTFIQRCEDTMSAENGAWTALWAKS